MSGNSLVTRIVNCTFSGNSASGNGSGLYLNPAAAGATTQIVNTIFNHPSKDIYVAATFGNFNNSTKNYGNSCSGIAGASCLTFDYNSGNSTLGLAAALANNGGPTQTLELLPASTLANVGANTATGANVPIKDQRNYSRTDAGIDLGAYERGGIQDDATAPAITYTMLANTTGTGDRTLTATITDANGGYGFAALAEDLRPRVYFRKNTGAWQSAAGTLASGTGRNGSWNFTISAAAMGGLANGDQVCYYVVAQDVSTVVNIASNPSGATATSVNNITAAPTPNCYNISSAPSCPTFSGAPANVSINNSTCASACTLSGGSITAPGGTPCPTGSTLEYQVNGSPWLTTLPVYDQDGPAQSIKTRCKCNIDANMVSAESSAVVTIPGTCATPTLTGPSSVAANATISLMGSGTPAGSMPYASNNMGVATVNNSGVVTGVSAGMATITYTANTGCTATKVITVTAPSTPGPITITNGCFDGLVVPYSTEYSPYNGRPVWDGFFPSVVLGGQQYNNIQITIAYSLANEVFPPLPGPSWVIATGGGNPAILYHPNSSAATLPPATGWLQWDPDLSCSSASSTVLNIGGSGPSCPTFSGAPANVSIVNSSCSSGCTLGGGLITAPTGTPCPAGSTLQYNVNNSGWTTSLPVYDQDGPAQSIKTRCICDLDANMTSAESAAVTTIPGTLANPVVPANGASMVACPSAATTPTPPTVMGCDGSTITPTSPMIVNSPNPVTCEGTRTYTYTYTCGSTSSTWSFVYTIERQPFTVPANGASTVNSQTLAVAPVLPTVTSNCGEVLTPAAPMITNSPDPLLCTGTRTYAYTYTDCEGNTATWSFVYTIVDNTPPMINCSNTTVTFSGEATIALNAANLASASDNCGAPSVSLSTATVACGQVGQTLMVTATATDAAGLTASCTSQVTVAGLPCGWSQNPDGIGCGGGNNVGFTSGVFTINSTGCYSGPPFTADAAGFAAQELCGNGSITAQVTSLNGGGWAGIVMRESDAPGTRKVQLTTNLATFHRREIRSTSGGAAAFQQFPAQNRYWLRILRQGNQFVGYVSATGDPNWSQLFAVTINGMPNCLEVGLMVTNNTATGTTSATFANVSIMTNPSLQAIETNDPGAEVVNLHLNVFPNPTSGEVTVDFTPWAGKPALLEVYDLQGRRVRRLELDEAAGPMPVDMHNLPGGVYLFRVGEAQQRLALQR